jgi:hypothetical protein
MSRRASVRLLEDRQLNRDDVRINSFLRFGYFCDYDRQRAPIDFSRIDKRIYENMPRDELVRLGVESLSDTFSELWQDGREHVVPLSGGLDSRLILGALLERTSADRIRTFTYGVAGSYDFDISNSIAKKYGTQHLPVFFENHIYSLDQELEFAKRTDCQCMLFYHPPLDEFDRQYDGAMVWSGYVGDAVAGSYLQARPSSSIRDAQLTHLKNRIVVNSTPLHNCTDEEFLTYMQTPLIAPELLTYDEQVLFDEAGSKFTAPLILFDGYEFVTPFINTPWMDFMLSVPNRYRIGQELMIEIGRRAFPALFSMPSKNRLGHTFDAPQSIVKSTFWLNRIRKALHQFIPAVNWPNFQCNDFNEGIRKNQSLRRIVQENIKDLRHRDICGWIDFDSIWRNHDRRIRNHGDALIILASLEIVLKASEMDQKS